MYQRTSIAAAVIALLSAANAQAAPSVSWQAPHNGQTLSGTLSGSACAAGVSSSVAMSRVTFWANNWQINNDYSSPFNCSFDTTRLKDGAYTLRAVAYDSNGASTTSSINVTIKNSGATTTPPANAAPSVSISAPASGATVSGSVAYSAIAADDKGVSKVVFSIDSTTLATDTASPYSGSLNTTTLANGTHTLKAVASDASGLTATAQVAINVQNGTSTPPTNPPPTTTPPTGGSNLPVQGKAVPTFHSIGLYWTPPSNPGAAGCDVIYRKVGDSSFSKGYPMWYDARNNECRGSIVRLVPATAYEVQFAMAGKTPTATNTMSTWSESFPVAQTITLPASSASTLNITSGGSAKGYVLYTAASNGSTIDVANGKANNIVISAPYVIIRGLNLKGAQQDAIMLTGGAHDVVIEDNDISNWGRVNYVNSKGWNVGVDMDSGIRCKNATNFERGIIQRNKIHDPRYGANSWDWGHPAGPQGITFSYCAGNHVIRYNEIYSSGGEQHYYNDGIGGEDNFSATGFPNYDSDIYNNKISQTWDDGIEAEGGNKNVRIYQNYTDNTNTGVASTVTNSGPLYVFRNVHNRSRAYSLKAFDQDDRNNAYKSGEAGGFGGGRRYMFHNTLLQAIQSGVTNGLGMGGGIAGNTGQPLTNTVSRNNILHVWKAGAYSVYNAGGSGDDADYDLHNGSVNITGAELHGIVGTPIYAAGNGWQNESGGWYQLAPNSLGYGKATPLPNFNDNWSSPDIGAHQSGRGAMHFGVPAGLPRAADLPAQP
jgi:hypothetical protein